MRHSGQRSLRYLIIPGLGFALVCAISAIFLAEGALHPARLSLVYRDQIRQRVAKQYGTELHEVSITAQDAAVLRAWYIEPLNANGSTVVLLHGLGDTRQGVAGFAPFMFDAGYSVLLPDSRAHGESGGDLVTYGVKEIHDVHDWVSWLIAQHTTGCVYGFGESMGAAIMLQALSKDDRLCAVVVESPFASFEEIAAERVLQISRINNSIVRQFVPLPVEFAKFYTQIRYGVDLDQASPSTALAKTHVPVLLIHGTADVNIPPHHSQKLAQVANRSTELWLVPGAGHCGAWVVEPGEFPRRVLDWFAMHSSRAPAVAASRIETYVP
jgi:pimeloyl-ACP methyl ester carboxylesterase